MHKMFNAKEKDVSICHMAFQENHEAAISFLSWWCPVIQAIKGALLFAHKRNDIHSIKVKKRQGEKEGDHRHTCKKETTSHIMNKSNTKCIMDAYGTLNKQIYHHLLKLSPHYIFLDTWMCEHFPHTQAQRDRKRGRSEREIDIVMCLVFHQQVQVVHLTGAEELWQRCSYLAENQLHIAHTTQQQQPSVIKTTKYFRHG